MENGHLPETLKRKLAILQLASDAAREGKALESAALVHETGASGVDVRELLEQLNRDGLLCSGVAEGITPILPRAGRQFLEREGHVPREVLRFLPRYVDDLNAREAMLFAGTVLVTDFRFELLYGDAVAHAGQLVPAGFSAAVDDALALDLFAAAVALMARLSDERPAGCLAEEILAVGLLERAKAMLAERCERGELAPAEGSLAEDELRGIFELFEDDKVLALFAIPSEGSAGEAAGLELSTLDQRIEGWFAPFSWAAPTGYLRP